MFKSAAALVFVLGLIMVLCFSLAAAGEKMTLSGLIQNTGEGLALVADGETYMISAGADADLIGKNVIVTGDVSADGTGKVSIALEEVQVQE
ncbi:MAG: hypothetical protein V1816_24355 [Pseudomonadota bacterium]